MPPFVSTWSCLEGGCLQLGLSVIYAFSGTGLNDWLWLLPYTLSTVWHFREPCLESQA